MRELENEGSELAVMIQAAYYDGAIDETGKKECLTRIAEKYPFFNLLLGESYVMKYHESEDFSYIQKAIDCYYKADAYGMLIPKYANALWGMYDYFGQKGMLEYDEQEVERLKVLAKEHIKQNNDETTDSNFSSATWSSSLDSHGFGCCWSPCVAHNS